MTRDLFAAAGLTLTPTGRRLVSAYDAIVTGPPARIDYLHTVFCQCPLPYRRPDRRIWESRQGHTFLRVEAGSVLDPRRDAFVELGLPYGEKPRLVLIHLMGEATRTRSPVIEVKDSMTAFARGLGLNANGRAVHHLRDQLNRLAAATVRLSTSDGAVARNLATRFITELDLWYPRDAAQRVLWPSVVRLSPEFFASLRKHAVPLDPRAVRALAHSAQALDAYVWLAQRLCRVAAGRGVFVPWAALKQQFGPDYRRVGDFRRRFAAVLARVWLVYPTARFKVDDGRGVTLYGEPAAGGAAAAAGPVSGRVIHGHLVTAAWALGHTLSA